MAKNCRLAARRSPFTTLLDAHDDVVYNTGINLLPLSSRCLFIFHCMRPPERRHSFALLRSLSFLTS
ncbi:hypothetical protein K7X08_008502 [Anisodus acutangulus]|uniref:Uncharacterized protein n=1 Tax=Anisodus acutangulus TaxID=402998 RepID=A0A9Q1RPE3_9SOLA|nr:hypothetical protein K7X08_008502 [Anisodus acutangulus]